MNSAFLLLGSNVGDRLDFLHQAAAQLAAHAGKIRKQSSVYETAAWGKIEQANYLNQALCLETGVSAAELLQITLGIESLLGRVRKKVWEPRIIDIDILFFNHDVIREEKLVIPHPHLEERRFVLVPLAEIAADYVHPVSGKSIRELLDTCPDPLWVREYALVPTCGNH